MKFAHLFYISILFLCSCVPQVRIHVSKTYPPTLPDSVNIFEIGDPVPNSYETIGSIIVYDGGLATKCQYDEVLDIAKRKTAETGGNGFMLTQHIRPSFWGSTCHQIAGEMLHLTQMDVDTLSKNPSSVTENLERTNPSKSIFLFSSPNNTFSAQIGYGWIISNLSLADGRNVNPLGGIEWRAEYNHTFKNGIGIGAIYAGYHREISDSYATANLLLNYLAPALFYSIRVNQFIFRVGFGVGAGLYNDGFNKYIHFATNWDMRFEYMLTDNIGIGLNAGSLLHFLPDQDDEYFINGIRRISFTGGIQYYF